MNLRRVILTVVLTAALAGICWGQAEPVTPDSSKGNILYFHTVKIETVYQEGIISKDAYDTLLRAMNSNMDFLRNVLYVTLFLIIGGMGTIIRRFYRFPVRAQKLLGRKEETPNEAKETK